MASYIDFDFQVTNKDEFIMKFFSYDCNLDSSYTILNYSKLTKEQINECFIHFIGDIDREEILKVEKLKSLIKKINKKEQENEKRNNK